MKVFLTIAIILAMGYFVVCYTEAEEEEFSKFKTKFEKFYATPEEEAKRKEVYFASVKIITYHNALYDQGKVSYKLEINEIADFFPNEVPTGFVHPKINETTPLTKL